MIGRLLRTGLLAATVSVAALVHAPALAQEDDRRIIETVLGDDIGAEQGEWRTKVQHVFDSATRSLIARSYAAFDPSPSRNLDFLWTPDEPLADRGGRISGRGTLVWRKKAMPAYDINAIVSAYTGEMREGRPHGQGRYVSRDGLSYEGAWRNGRFEGVGALQLPTGEEYHGAFRGGFAAGQGRYIDLTGEVFEGPFVAGLREGEGRTILPGGLVYRSRWAKGVEAPGSVEVRVAQLGAQPPGQASADTIRLGVNVVRKPKTEDAKDGLGYVAKTEGEVLLVTPDDPQMFAVWKRKGTLQEKVNAIGGNGFGTYRTGMFGFDKNVLFPPKFTFDIQNKSTGRIEVTGFYLDVRKSESDNQPALQLQRGIERTDCSDGSDGKPVSKGNFAPYFTLTNYGWGAVEKATMSFAFQKQGDRATPSNFPLTKTIARFEKTMKVDLSDAIARSGGKLDALRRFGKDGFQCKIPEGEMCVSGSCKVADPAQCINEIRATQAFGSLGALLSLDSTDAVVAVRGKLDYEYKNARGEPVTDSAPMLFRMNLAGLIEQAECGEGGPPDPIRDKPVAFKLDQENYKIPLPFRRAIDPGRSNSFTLAVNAPRASRHGFQVVAQLSDGREIRSRTIDLYYFLPKWHPDPIY